MKLRLMIPLVTSALLLFPAGPAHAAENGKAIKALMVAGGCCHDYPAQKKIISEGISARANVEWTIVHDKNRNREHEVDLYNDPDWAKGYDVIVHNECFGGVTNVAFIHRITQAHADGVPAVMLHCATHSYRAAKTDEWRKAVGQSSSSHERSRDLNVENIAPDHPIMKGFPKVWVDPYDELYTNDKMWPTVTPLAKTYGKDTKKDHVVVWVNTYGKGRIFATTLGHQNETMASPVYLDLVTRGLLWAVGELGEDGKRKP